MLIAGLDEALRTLTGPGAPSALALEAAADSVEAVDALLHGVAGIRTLLADRATAVALEDRAARITDRLRAVEDALDRGEVPSEDLERANAAVVRCKDATWAVARERLRNARAVGDILGNFFNRDGRMVDEGVRDRVIGLSENDLRAIPCVVGIASEAGKAVAVRAALRTGIVDILVAPLALGREILAEDDADERPEPTE